MKIVEVKEKKMRVTLEISRSELKYIWHRLNLAEGDFKEAYAYSQHINAYKKLKCNIHDIWGIFNKLLEG